MKIFAWILLIVGLILLCGCRPSGVVDRTMDNGQSSVIVKDNNGVSRIVLVVLEDGTTCAVLNGHQKGAIDCKWEQQ